MNNKAMIIGAIDAGKTTLINELVGNDAKAAKTQTLQYHQWIVDTPGEYTENPLFYKNIMATSFQMTHVIYVQDATTIKNIFPPGFASGIPKLSIGVVTKADAEDANIERSIEQLKKVMIRGPIVVTSAVHKIGIEYIKPLVNCRTYEEMKQFVEQINDAYLIYLDK